MAVVRVAVKINGSLVVDLHFFHFPPTRERLFRFSDAAKFAALFLLHRQTENLHAKDFPGHVCKLAMRIRKVDSSQRCTRITTYLHTRRSADKIASHSRYRFHIFSTLAFIRGIQKSATRANITTAINKCRRHPSEKIRCILINRQPEASAIMRMEWDCVCMYKFYARDMSALIIRMMGVLSIPVVEFLNRIKLALRLKITRIRRPTKRKSIYLKLVETGCVHFWCKPEVSRADALAFEPV